LLQDRLVRAQRDVEIEGIDDVQYVALMNELIIDDSAP
jgi:hypothetical protein